MALTPGSKLGPYEIQSPLGAGGMGEVYRATDTKLGRDVALKVLPAEMAQDPERLGRFRREAKALAQLDHPNIVTIYSVEESDGVHFLTMQLVEGQPLDRLICAGGLPLEQIVEIASALGDALAAAHEKGIVHRDLKPANVMVSHEGRVKVLDFGLAKDVRGSNLGDATMTSASRTEVGVVMGTPAYMSPEQTSGRPLDHRTDIFSLGVLLHEMATGRRPFEGSSSAELVSAILRDTPPSVTDVRPDLPSDLARIVRRCLEKDPRHRLQTARDVSNEFRDLARHASRPAPVSTAAPRMAPPPDSGAVRADEGFWVAVLPFKHAGSNPDLAALADGLTDDTITGLSKFSYLRVIARSSSSRYVGQSVDVRTAGKELNARYVMEATLRQAGSKLRLAVQLVDSISGAHLWAENYERPFSAETIFELQDDLVPRIVSTVADMNGVLPRSMSEGLRNRPPEQLSPYEAVLRSFAYTYSATPEELAAARSGLEEAVRKAPAYADAWAMLSFLCGQDYVHGYELQPNALEIATSAARRAVALGASNHLAYFSLGQALWCHKDYDSFRDAAERAVVLNPMDGNSVAYLGELLIYAGSAERAMQLVERAKQLNPNHPGWYWFADFYHAFSRGEYRDALSFALKAKLRGNPLAPMFVAAAYGQLGDVEGGAIAAAELMKFRPELPALMRKQVEKVWNPEYGERFLEGLRKAGLEIPEAGATASQKSATQPTSSTLRTGAVPDSGATRADEGFWVGVLPFKYAGTSAELKSLADGLSEEIVTGLSRFSYLRVIARSSTSRFANQAVDIRSAGKELGARYVMEGSLRQAGTKLRLVVQLVDTVSGAHLWAENYERTFSPENLFELQDDLVPRIVSTAADQHGILPRRISEELRVKNEEDLTPHEAVLRSFSFLQRISPIEHATARRILERAVERDPNQADAWAMLAIMYDTEFADEYNPRPNPLERAITAAQRAVDLAPTHALGYYALAFTYFFRKDNAGFRAAVEQAITLNPMDGSVMGLLGLLVHHVGEIKRGTQMVEAAMQLNPHYPPVFRAPAFLNAYAEGKYAEALELAVRFNMPGFFHAHALRAAALGQLGQREAAQQAVQELLAVRPDFAATVRRDYGKWWDAKTVDHLVEGLRQAGLEIPEDQKTVSSSTAAAAPSIAVLPFANMSDDKEQDYFSDGLAEEIINLLAQIPGLKVIARTSAFAFRGKEQDIRGIAEALGVSTVLEGSVRRAGSRIRVTAQLINAADGSHLWSERYDRELSDIFAVQDEISAAIAKALRVKLSPEAASQRYTPKLEAYEVYLKGKYLQAKVTPESMELARRCYEQASELDPAFGLAHVGLGYYWVSVAHFGRRSVHECVPAARAEAERALQIDPSLADAHALLGYVAAMYDLDWAVAEKHFDFPMAKQASFETIRPMYSGVQFLRGNVEQAIKLAQHAIEDDPLDVWAHMNLHAYLQAAGRDDEALEQLKKVVELDPNQVVAMVSMAMIHAHKGDMAEALKIARRAYAVGSWFPDTVGVLAGLTRRNGEEIESKSLEKALGSGEALGDARAHALFHLLGGEIDQGADWVEKAITQRDPSMMFYLRFVVSRGLRASHRWPKIAKMINLPVAAEAPSVHPARD